MHSLALPTIRPPRALVRGFGRLLLSLTLVVAPTAAARAQVSLTHTDDAAPIPRGMLRVKATTGWTLFDERFIAGGRSALGDAFATDSLGPRQLPALAPVEQGLRSLANDNRMRLSFGRLAATSGARIVTTPVALEYGLTSRISIGVLIPLVQTRQTIQLHVNGDSSGNVGFVPLRSRTSAAQANLAVYAAFKSAADSIGKLIALCPANPMAGNCAAVNANASDAAAARQQAQAFADAVKQALGTDSTTALVAPLAKSPLALAIDAQRTAINAAIRTYLGGGAGAASGVFTSTGNFSYVDLQGRNGTPGLLQSALGGGLDSLRTTNRLQTGDISVGAQLLLFDRFRRDTLPFRGWQSRMVVGGSFRFATSLVDTARNLVGFQTGDGAGVELRSAMDVASNTLGGTVAARVVKSFARKVVAPLLGDPEATYPIPVFGTVTRTAGTVVGLDVTPRYLPNDYFSLNGHYGLERIGSTTYDRSNPMTTCTGCDASVAGTFNTPARLAQRIGFGLRYSTVNAYAAHRVGFPVEISFTHLETITGDPGTPKLFRDQVQLRLFVRVLGGQ